jgi:WD40 repeat protein
VLRGHAPGSLAIEPDGRRIATVDIEGTIRVWNLDATGARPAATWSWKGGGDLNLSFGDDRRGLVVAGPRGVRRYDLEQPSVPPTDLVTLAGPPSSMKTNLSQDGRVFVAAGTIDSGSPGLRAWFLDRPGVPAVSLDSGPAILVPSALHADSRRVISVTGGATTGPGAEIPASIRVWNLDPGLLQGPPVVLAGIRSGVRDVAVHPGGRSLIATGTVLDEKKVIAIQCWDLDKAGNPGVSLFEGPDVRQTIAFHPDGRRLFTTDDDGTLFMADLEHPRPPHVSLRELEEAVTHLACHPDGHRLAAARSDGTVLLADLDRLEDEVVVLYGHTGRLHDLTFSPDGRRLITAGTDGTVRIWGLDMDVLIDLAAQRVGRNLTRLEWNRFFPREQSYRRTFPELPEPKAAR